MEQRTGLDAPITAVTVFRDGARVVRTGMVDTEPGLRPVVIGDLPASADPASVRVAARGRDVALLNVEVHRGYGADPLRDEVTRLRSEAERSRDAVQELDDEDAAEQAGLGFIGHLSEAAAGALARAVSFGRAGQDDLVQMAGHLSASTASALGRRREISVRRRAAHRELQAAEQRLADAERKAGRPAEFIEVSAMLEAGAATRAEVELSYHVSGASWRPLYDLGLAGERLTVSYLAEVVQRTGEDWPAVELVLSTTRRGVHQTLPELRPWYVGRATPVRQHFRATAASMAGGPMLPQPGAEELLSATVPNPAFAPAAPVPQAAPLTAEAGETGAGLIYRVPRPLAVPADGGPHKTMVARLELDTVLDHLAVPVLAPEAYLRATVTNGSSLLLLPGPARVFNDGQFVGETALETVAAGEEFELQLGVDDQIRVERELRRRSTSKAVIGGTRTIDIGYEIRVQNHRAGKARISVHDHIPVSADGEIKVRLREASPDPAAHSDLGELTWQLELDGGQAQTIRYRFTVEHPAQVTITGL
ncbi:MAG TPA: mucoidy inhibitor MuiA family protein [Streptosporangiaceae bacterium]|nr:mucoidy inhibitor MuiA family protein [Streptosporangiaceae bacterium]